MKLKLTPLEIDLLKSRVNLARETNLFTLFLLTENWDISLPTLLRYNYPSYRLASVKASQHARANTPVIDKNKCQVCRKTLKEHVRCSTCTMLIHGSPECACLDAETIALINNEVVNLHHGKRKIG